MSHYISSSILSPELQNHVFNWLLGICIWVFERNLTINMTKNELLVYIFNISAMAMPGEQGMWVERKGNTGKREGRLKLMTGVGLDLGELKFRIYFAMYSVLI